MADRRRRIGLSLSVVAVCAGLTAAAAIAQDVESVLPGRPAPAPVAGDTIAADPLDAPFVSLTAGISVRPPAGGTLIRRSGGGDEIARVVNEEKRWRFVISRIVLSEGIPLFTRPGLDAAQATDVTLGFAESVAQQMPNDTPGKMLRSEPQPINGYDGAVLATRFRESGVGYLMQQAIIRRTDKHYYVVSYATPLGAPDADVTKDAAANRALETFGDIIDSVQIIDQEQIATDQTDRLVRTRSLLINWTAPRMRSAIVGEQWLRLIKDGKDIGYTYIIEELANDVPRAGRQAEARIERDKARGVRIGVRSRTMPEAGKIVDGESWMWVSFDRGQEAFSNVVIHRAQPKPGESIVDEDYSMERGTSIRRDRTVPQVVPNEGGVGTRVVERKDDRYELQIWSTAKRQTLPPLSRELPPYYLPQALGHLLPRLVPLTTQRTYMFASYVPDGRQVMTRYVDVLPIATVDLAGTLHTAVPVQERIGLEGSVTTHYVTPAGRYVGSTNVDNKIVVVATDADTLLRIWKDANLQRPGEVDDAAASDSTPRTTP